MQIKNANIVLTKISQQLNNQLLNLFSINFQRYFIDFSFLLMQLVYILLTFNLSKIKSIVKNRYLTFFINILQVKKRSEKVVLLFS